MGSSAIMGRAAVAVTLGCVLAGAAVLVPIGKKTGRVEREVGHALTVTSAGKLSRLYARWKAQHEAMGGDRNVILPLGAGRGVSKAPQHARGLARLNLIDGIVRVEVSGAPLDVELEVWLVDNQDGVGAALFDEGDAALRLGTLVPGDGRATLSVQLDPGRLMGFEVDSVVVARAGEGPSGEPFLVGLPKVFQRLYTKERVGRLEQYALSVESLFKGKSSRAAGLAELIGLSEASAASAHVNVEVLMSSMAALGADLFLNETFDGNGRTCGTCHPPANNYTIDAQFIASLPADDPLFVAETNPELAELEVPQLLRSHGLILENLDGFDKPGVLRSVPHTLSLSQSIAPPMCVDVNGCAVTFPDGTVVTFPYGAQAAFLDVTTPEATGFAPVSTDPPLAYPLERTGWSGDGAPGSGTLREFAIGAVVQHFPRRLARQVGVDFRLPTDEELDALELFQLSLGRIDDPDLSKLSFKHPLIERGKEVFMKMDTEGGTVSAGKCIVCHSDAGANTTPEAFGEVVARFGVPKQWFGNQSFSTGVNNLPVGETHAPPGIPRDGGMGIRPMGAGDCVLGSFDFSGGFPVFIPQEGGQPGGYGAVATASFLPEGLCLELFNAPPLVEAADTAPFFHNNAFHTLEEAVAFYNSDTFNKDPSIALFMGSIDSGGIAIKLDDEAVTAIAHFLRVLNVLENLRQSEELGAAALVRSDATITSALLDQAHEELEDAHRVLSETGLHRKALAQIKVAMQLNRVAARLPVRGTPWQRLVSRSNQAMAAARGDLVVQAQ